MGECQYILIVDDDARVLFVLNRALRALENGHRCIETAQSGQEALEKVLAKFYVVVITDIVMPGISGVELTAAIKDAHSDTMVIWITAHGCHRFETEREQLGIYRCLEKPVQIAEIRQVALDALEHRQE
jgi:DNA-binding NtrC family response regulator